MAQSILQTALATILTVFQPTAPSIFKSWNLNGKLLQIAVVKQGEYHYFCQVLDAAFGSILLDLSSPGQQVQSDLAPLAPDNCGVAAKHFCQSDSGDPASVSESKV